MEVSILEQIANRRSGGIVLACWKAVCLGEDHELMFENCRIVDQHPGRPRANDVIRLAREETEHSLLRVALAGA
jgi:hypothetical protein